MPDESHNHNPSMPYIPPLDGVRGIAVLMVLLHHSVQFAPLNKFDHYFLRVATSSWIGVDLFFVLSGFLITSILLRTKHSSTYFRSFYARRALRIFPLYFLFVGFSIYLVPHIPMLLKIEPDLVYSKQWWYWGYLSNFLAAKEGAFYHTFLSPTWTLAIEEQFYLVWPVIVLLCNTRSLILVSLAIICGSPLLRSVLFMSGVSGHAIHTMTITRMDPLAMGSLVACLSYGYSLSPAVLKAVRYLGAALLITHVYFVKHGLIHKTQPYMNYAGYSVVALLCGCLLLLVAHLERRNMWYRCLTMQPLVRLGAYSYAVYLFNRPLVPFLRLYVFNPNSSLPLIGSQVPNQMAFLGLVTLSSCALAMMSWWLIEKRFLVLKRYFPTTARPSSVKLIVERSPTGASSREEIPMFEDVSGQPQHTRSVAPFK